MNPNTQHRLLPNYSQFSDEKLETHSVVEPLQLKAFEDQIDKIYADGFAAVASEGLRALRIESVFINRKITAINTELAKRKEEHSQ